jgi:hypothetical protein
VIVGDLVKVAKGQAMGIVVEVFSDLGPTDPWVRVLFTHPSETYQWVKKSGLRIVTSEELKQKEDP